MKAAKIFSAIYSDYTLVARADDVDSDKVTSLLIYNIIYCVLYLRTCLSWNLSCGVTTQEFIPCFGLCPVASTK